MIDQDAFVAQIRTETGAEVLLYLADLVPTRAHLGLPWIMAYDLEPLLTLEQKRRWLTRAGDDGWLLIFEHDPVIACARAIPAKSGSGCRLEDERPDLDWDLELDASAPDGSVSETPDTHRERSKERRHESER